MNNMVAIEFAESVFTGRFPHGNPFIRDEWIGVSFDRNRHEQLAPLEWWRVLVAFSKKKSHDQKIFAVEKTAEKTAFPSSNEVIAAAIHHSEKSIFEYLHEDARFLKDHYLVAESGEWACLLDQDVSLFGGDERFMETCFSEYGGRQLLLAQMRDEFFGKNVSVVDSTDRFVLDFESYFHRLLHPRGKSDVVRNE